MTTNETVQLPSLPSLLHAVDRGTVSTGWDRRHNRAVACYFGARAHCTPDEARILAMLDAFHRMAAVADGYTLPNILEPMHHAISDALSLELGRLDGGTLSRAQWAIWERAGGEVTA